MGCESTVHFVLGGTRSGKSAYAQTLAERLAGDNSALTYVATAEPFDDEMRVRVRAHQAARDARWQTLEVPIDLGGSLRRHAGPNRVLLVDCLSVWLGNLLHHDIDVDAQVGDLLECVPALASTTVFVASEVGLGIVPDTAAGRDYRDRAGLLNQSLGALSDSVTLVVAGQPLHIKQAVR